MPETDADRPRLLAGAAALGVELDAARADALLAFGAELKRWNHAFNLVSRRDVQRLLPRHLLDSLSAAPLLAGAQVLDLGTGAGLPGVPLAIVRSDMHFTLADRNQRKIRFVSQAVRRLGLGNVTPLCVDVARLPGGPRFDTVVTRAVARAAELWALAEPVLVEGGRLVLLHRARQAADQPAVAGPAADQGGSVDADLPADARVLGRHQARIPGLAEPHEVLVLGRAADIEGHRSAF